MKRQALVGQRVVILGYGKEGKASHRALLEVLDPMSISVWAEVFPDLSDVPPQIQSVLASSLIHRPFDEGLGEFDVAIRSPGIRVDHPALLAFRKEGKRVLNPSSIFFAEQPSTKVIGVTGSKGKSTTASLLAHLLQQAGRSVCLAGNIGKPLIDCLGTSSEVVVAELSSYQLADLEGALELGVITRLFPEHIDWHGSVDAYYQSKMRLFDQTGPLGVLVHARDPILMEQVQHQPLARPINLLPEQAKGTLHRQGPSIVLGTKTLFASDQWTLSGQHNIDNAVMALAAAQCMGEDPEKLASSLGQFQALAHRLSPVRTQGAIRWINDSIATSPHATRAALESLAPAPIVLVAGGFDRGGDWSVVMDHLQDHRLLGLVTLPDSGPSVGNRLMDANLLEPHALAHATTMDEVVIHAKTLAGDQSGVVVLLSPGAPSFGQFRDFEDRGNQFIDAVARLDCV